MSRAMRRREGRTPREIVAHMDRFVIGQTAAKRALAVAAYRHQCRIADVQSGKKPTTKKSNVLLVGPTGTGKTLLAARIAESLDVPFTVADATEYTAAGYYGRDVGEILKGLLAAAGNTQNAETGGIVFIDEVDKLARARSAANDAATLDIGGEQVQRALLTMMEGRRAGAESFGRNEPTFFLDTTNVLFICAGAFSDAYDDEEAQPKRPVGFGAAAGSARRRRMDVKRLVRYGMLPEFLGRLPVLAELEPPGVADLERILTEPEDALAKEFAAQLAADGIDVRMAPDAVRTVAEAAFERGLGARGLRAAMERVFEELLFDAPDLPPKPRTITAAYVRKRLADA